jgi:peptidoglycan hydrolase CwlO-like protein
MTQTTDTDIREIKTAIEGNTNAISALSNRVESIVLALDTNTKAIGDLTTSVTGLREEIRVGFTRIDGELKEVNGRLTAVENTVKSLDARLWGFGGTLLGSVLAALLAIFGRFLFANTPLG